MMGYQAGDVIEVETSGRSKEVVILQIHERYALVLELKDTEPDENAFQIRSRAMMWTDTGKIGYAYPDKMTGFKRKLAEDEFAQLKMAVGETLGLFCDPFDDEPSENVQEEPSSMEQLLEELEHTVVEDIEELLKKSGIGSGEVVLEENVYEMQAELRNDLVKAEAERDVYKELYTELRDKLMA